MVCAPSTGVRNIHSIVNLKKNSLKGKSGNNVFEDSLAIAVWTGPGFIV
jgi:hypothetical protein